MKLKPVDFVESHDKGRLFGFQQVDGLDGLRFEAVHDIDDEDSDIAQRRAPGAEIAERFVAGSVDDEQTGDLQRQVVEFGHHFGLFFDGVDGDVGGADLLGDSTGLAVLDVGPSQFVQNLRLARVDVAQDANHRRPQHLDAAILLRLLLPFLFAQKIQ